MDWQDVVAAATSPTGITTVALLPTLTALGVSFRYFNDERRAQRKGQVAEQQKREEDLEAARASLTKDQNDLFERVKKENHELWTDNELLQRRLDWWRDVAIAWADRARDLKHLAENTFQMVVNVATLAGRPVPEWKPVELPPLKQIIDEKEPD